MHFQQCLNRKAAFVRQPIVGHVQGNQRIVEFQRIAYREHARIANLVPCQVKNFNPRIIEKRGEWEYLDFRSLSAFAIVKVPS